jgi:hypothetical protein
MLEHIVQMGPMLVLAGLIAGWVAEAASRAGGYRFVFALRDMSCRPTPRGGLKCVPRMSGSRRALPTPSH